MNFREWDIKILILSAYVISSYIIFLVYRKWFYKKDNYYYFSTSESAKNFDTGCAFVLAPFYMWLALPIFVTITALMHIGACINHLTSKNK